MNRSFLLGCCLLLPAAACDPAPLEGKSCPCVGAYVCCAARNACIRSDEVCVSAATWPVATAPTAPVPLDDVTVYAFSQVDTNNSSANVDDPQLGELRPDLVVRAWAQWNHYGTGAADYQFSYIGRTHDNQIRYFTGGATATVMFREQVTSDAELDDFTTRDAGGAPVVHANIDFAPRRATLANPLVRDALVRIGQVQIDGLPSGNALTAAVGVDGLHFEEINGGYQGEAFTGNEGFDDYHLADFNAYLLGKYPPGTDFARLFGMRPDNILRRDVPPWDLTHNFRYRQYLAEHGWQATPLTSQNPLAGEWGATTINRPTPGAPTFVDSAEPYVYWKDIVDRLRVYARAQGRDILITAEGIWPFVDFQSVGLDLHNTDAPDGTPVSYVPVSERRLDGRVSLKEPFLHLGRQAAALAPGAPVVLFLDGRQDAYDAFPDGGSDRSDYWRLYAAEAYANGLFFAFHLKSSVGTPPERTATELGLMPLFQGLTAFYRAHAGYYHGGVISEAAATASLPSAMVTVVDQLPARRLVHLVNHEYLPGTGIITQTDVRLTIASDAGAGVPVSLALASPDLPADVDDLPFSYADGQIVTTLPALAAYDVVVISYAPRP